MKTHPFLHRAGVVLAAALFCGTTFSNLRAVGFQAATVTEAIHIVNLEKEGSKARPAAKEDQVQGKDRLWTGKKSRAELEFKDRSIARLGSNTIFSFDPARRQMKVDQGTALIHIPPGLQGAQISSPAATAAVTGDVLATRVDDKGVTQFVALSEDAKGPIKVTFHKTGETRELRAGQMLTIDPMAAKIPEPVNVAVDVMVQSSNLTHGFKKDLPDSAQKEIKQTTDLQAKEIKSGALEGKGKLMAKNDVTGIINNTSANQIITQAAATSSIAGTYTGTAFWTGFGNTTDPFGITINSDGSFNITTYNPNTNSMITGSGVLGSSSYSARMNDGSMVTGNGLPSHGTTSGSISPANPISYTAGTYNATKK